MAENNNVDHNLVQLEKEITCGICQEHYTEPKVLPCFHYYCKECVLKLALRTVSDEPFSCPECRRKTTLPEGGVEELKTAFFIDRLKSNLVNLKLGNGTVEVKCKGCAKSEGKAEAFCRQCAVFICKECIKQHKRMIIFATHEVDLLEDLTKCRERTLKENFVMKCLVHQQPLLIYCFDCCCLVCRDCSMTLHKEHKFEFNVVAAPFAKKKLAEEIRPLNETSATLRKAMVKAKATKEEVEVQGSQLAESIHASFDELHQILERREQELLQEISFKTSEKVNSLTVQEKSLSLASAEVQSILDYTDRLLVSSSDDEIMYMHAEISDRIQRTMKTHQSSVILKPEVKTDIGCEIKCAVPLEKLCKTHASITRIVPLRVANYSVKGDCTMVAELNQTSNFVLSSRLDDDERVDTDTTVSCQLTAAHSESIINCDVNELDPGQYHVQYTPSVCGQHELAISVNGQQIVGSPFSVCVSVSPKLLGKPAKIWKDISNPTSIVVNSLGEVIVSSRNGLTLLDKDGEKEPLLGSTFSNLKFTFGSITINKDDDIYCVNFTSSKILRCDKHGGNVTVCNVKQLKGPGHYGVAAIGDELMVCECDSKGTIVVYDFQLNFLRSIEHADIGKIYNISSDSGGNLFISDMDHSCIRVLDKAGTLLRSFGCDTKSMKRLLQPRGVCVCGQYVYVSDWGSHSVIVFTTAGEYVTLFGQCGGSEGHFQFPHGICVGPCVWVADSGNDRVQCF